jgi:uncharacterized protein (DUF885 family)
VSVSPASSAVPRHPVEELADRYWDSFLAQAPGLATLHGDERFDDRLEDPTPEGLEAFRALNAGTLEGLDGLRETGPRAEGEAAITESVLRAMCTVFLELHAAHAYFIESIDQMDGPQVVLPLAAQIQRFDSPERMARWEARLAAYPVFVDAHIARIAEARAAGVVPPRIVATRVVEQIERALSRPPEESPMVTRAVDGAGPGTEPGAIRERLARIVETEVRPADSRFLEAVQSALGAARDEPGLCALPGGDTIYAARMHYWTSMPLTPGELHKRGLEELEAIEEERKAIADAAGFGPDTREYRRALAADERNIPGSRDELLERMREDVDRALEVAPHWFGRLPRARCLIEPLDAAQEADSLGHYMEPTPDGSRPGAFYMNTSDLPKRLFTRFATVTYHETIPGHHLQLALDTEREGVSRFRREASQLVSGAFVEGWGLYSERLADEMDLYRNAGERFGMLDAQAWRAARLVIDTGIHAFGWDRDRGVDLFEEATGFDRDDAAIEVDRYIAIPGQALAYKVGQRQHEQLRREAADAAALTGQAFDIRHFHDELLGHGSLPLEVVAAHLPRWLEGSPEEPG